jgi:Aspartyl protease/PDZ domain
MRRTLLAWAVAALFVPAGGLPRSAGLPQAAAPRATIPFELANRLIVLKIRVNGSRPLSFVLDTGAGAAIIRTEAARELGLALYGNVRSGGAGEGSQSGQFVRDATWSLVGFDGFSQPLRLALPFSDLPSAMGCEVDGIIGGEFIKPFVVELDYEAHKLAVHDPAAFDYRGDGTTLPLDFTPSGYPVLTAQVTPLSGDAIERPFLLDIGNGLALALHSPFVSEQHLPGPQSHTIRAIDAAGAGGRTVGRLGRVAALRIGPFTISRPITLFSEDKAGAFANVVLAGNIGAQVANRFRMFLDYGRRRVILEPSPAFAEPFDRAFSGLALRADGRDFRTFRVHEVLEQSPATEAGIAEGDVIIAIDGAAANDLTLSTIDEMFEKSVAHVLTIRRGDQVIKTTLTPKPLI